MLLLGKYFQNCQACFDRSECEWVNVNVNTIIFTATYGSIYQPIGTQSGQNRPDYFVDISLTKAFLSKIFEGEMFIGILPTTLLQIFCENLFYFQVIFISMKIADDTFLGNSECEWVNQLFDGEL